MRVKNEVKIYEQFKKVVNSYNLINEADCLAVQISTDKNCLALLDCLLKYEKEMNHAIKLEFFVQETNGEVSDANHSIINRYKINSYTVIKEEAKEDIYNIVAEQGCTKIALPQNYNDMINVSFMTLMEKKKVAKVEPKRHSKQKDSIEFIRPICLVEDKLIEKWLKEENMEYINVLTLFSELSYLEEDLVCCPIAKERRYEFNIYERV